MSLKVDRECHIVLSLFRRRRELVLENGDGRQDILRKDGWWRPPVDKNAFRESHPFEFANIGGAERQAYDVNGDV